MHIRELKRRRAMSSLASVRFVSNTIALCRQRLKKCGFLPLSLVVFAQLFLAPSVLIAQVTSRNAEDSLFRFLMLGMKNERDRLQTGIFRAYGRTWVKDEVWGEFKGDVELFCTFDSPKSLLRFDRVEQKQILREGAERSAKTARESWTVQTAQTKFITTSQKVLFRDDVQNQAVLILPAAQTKHEQARPFDIRSLGLVFYVDFVNNVSFSDIYQVFSEQLPDEMAKETENVHRLRWAMGKAMTKTLWIDEKQGFSPIRLELRMTGSEKNEDNQQRLISEVTWVLGRNVWIPKTFRIQDELSAGQSRGYEFSFEWEAINTEIPERLFTVEGMDIKDKTYIIDTRLGKGFVIEVINDDVLPLALSENVWSFGQIVVFFLVLVMGGYLGMRGCLWLRKRRLR
jgi:hypothetical protein